MKDHPSAKFSSVTNNFLVFGKKSRVVFNANCILCEPESQPNYRTIIPLNLVVAVRSCSCRKVKKLFCECIEISNNCDQLSSLSSVNLNGNSFNSGLSLPSNIGSTSSSSASSSSTVPSSNRDSSESVNGHNKMNHVRVYYGIPSGKFAWKLNHLILDPVEQSEQQIAEWIVLVNSFLKDFNRPKSLMIFINPYGGKKKGPKIYRDKIAPLFAIAGCSTNVITTQRVNHARDVITDPAFPINSYDGLICVGGDGMFSELLNGLLIRTQTDGKIDHNNPQSTLLPPNAIIGVIPAGSTDAVCFGVCGNNDPVTAAMHIILGNQVSIDVSAIHSARDEGKLLRYGTTILGYGFFGDVMADSEKNRWMGPKRYDWAGFKKILAHKVYQGEIKLHVSTLDGSPKDPDICTSDCALCAKSGLRSRYDSVIDPHREVNDGSCIAIRGRFMAINAVTMSCRCEKAKRGLSPAAHLGNGCADLIIVSKCSRLDYIRYMMRTGYLAKSPFDLDFVDVYRVKEFEFNPIVRPEGSSSKYQVSNASVWNCDGEIINEPALHVKVHCQLLPIFGNGRENRDLNGKGAFTMSANKIFDTSRPLNSNGQLNKSMRIDDQTNDNGNDMENNLKSYSQPIEAISSV
ncbi:ceramide kinase [Tetranychus urticae]|uniref:DAGKc domain-containing protein n=1 Tax=Tetranychus urticae TaxID=32264 RepID=T1KHB2_TETUR|nr:ceramide kinase [Tetranychus urticae]